MSNPIPSSEKKGKRQPPPPTGKGKKAGPKGVSVQGYPDGLIRLSAELEAVRAEQLALRRAIHSGTGDQNKKGAMSSLGSAESGTYAKAIASGVFPATGPFQTVKAFDYELNFAAPATPPAEIRVVGSLRADGRVVALASNGSALMYLDSAIPKLTLGTATTRYTPLFSALSLGVNRVDDKASGGFEQYLTATPTSAASLLNDPESTQFLGHLFNKSGILRDQQALMNVPTLGVCNIHKPVNLSSQVATTSSGAIFHDLRSPGAASVSAGSPIFTFDEIPVNYEGKITVQVDFTATTAIATGYVYVRLLLIDSATYGTVTHTMNIMGLDETGVKQAISGSITFDTASMVDVYGNAVAHTAIDRIYIDSTITVDFPHGNATVSLHDYEPAIDELAPQMRLYAMDGAVRYICSMTTWASYQHTVANAFTEARENPNHLTLEGHRIAQQAFLSSDIVGGAFSFGKLLKKVVKAPLKSLKLALDPVANIAREGLGYYDAATASSLGARHGRSQSARGPSLFR